MSLSPKELAHITVCGVASSRLGKVTYLAPVAGLDRIIRDPGEPLAWRSPKHFNEPDAKVPKRFIYEWHSTPDLATRAALRENLSKDPSRALMLGVLAEGHAYGELLPRNQTVLRDAPRAFLTIDLEGVRLPGIDVIEQDGELHAFLFDIFERADLEWMIADLVMHLSSGHGLLDRSEIRAHIEWHPSEPLSLAQQKQVAEYITKKLEQAGIGGKADSTIYEPARLLFTGPPSLTRRDWIPGVGFRDSEVTRPIQRIVRYVRGGASQIVIPPEIFTAQRVRETLRRLTGQRIPKKQGGDKELRPENVYEPIRGRIYAAAQKVPNHRLPHVMRELQATLLAEVQGIPASDEGQLRKRIDWIMGKRWEESWRGAIDKRYGKFYQPEQGATMAREGHDVAPVREAIAVTIKRFVDRALRGNLASALLSEQDATLVPRHLLLPVPPGIGKTRATIEAIRPDHLTLSRIHYLTPRKNLSNDVRGLAHAQDLPEYHQSLIRHHIGRAHWCEQRQPGLHRLAEEYEKLGFSPLKPICSKCPDHDICEWPAQRRDVRSGLVIMQHANLYGLLRQDADDEGSAQLNIIDESLLSVVLGKPKQRKIGSLRRVPVVRRDRSGHAWNAATADARAGRSRVLDTLEQCDGQVPCSAVAWLLESQTVKILGVPQVKSQIDWYEQEEEDVRHQYSRELEAATGQLLKGAVNSTGKPRMHAVKRAGRQMQTSQFFSELYRALKASLSNPSRTHVAGVRVIGSGLKKTIQVQIRTNLPPSWLARDGLWLDGTADPDIWAAFFGDAPQRGAIEIQSLDMPVKPGPYRLVQFGDKTYSKSWFLKNPHRILQLVCFIWLVSAKHPKDVFVAVQKGVELALRKYALPPNVYIEHFNNLDGRNDWEHCSCAIVVGRAMPAVVDLEVATEALFYDASFFQSVASHGTERLSGRQTVTTRVGPYSMPAERHRDEIVDKLKRALVDGQCRQALHRLRLYSRTESNPAELYVFGQWDAGLVIDELCDWHDSDYSPIEVTAALGVLPNAALARNMVHGLHADASDSSLRNAVAAMRRRLIDTTPMIKTPDSNNTDEGGTLMKDSDHWSCRSEHETPAAWRRYSMRLDGRSGLDEVWVNVAQHADPKAAVERLLNVHVLGCLPVRGD